MGKALPQVQLGKFAGSSAVQHHAVYEVLVNRHWLELLLLK